MLDLYVTPCGWFPVPEDALSPDHIVYAKSHPLFGEPTKNSVDAFVQKQGYLPRIVVTGNGVFGVDNSDPNRIYPFTIYPQVRGLLRYFVAASRQWQDARAQFLSIRGQKD